MDKKIWMLGLMLSGNVFGMDKLEVLNDYRNLSEQTKTEIVSKDQINDILTKFDLFSSKNAKSILCFMVKKMIDFNTLSRRNCKTNRSIFENYREIEACVGQVTKAKDLRKTKI